MGDPRRFRKHVVGPRHPWTKERLEQELVILGRYGLRNKKELWRASTKVRRYRQRAREMLALPEDIREANRQMLGNKLYRLGIVEDPNAPIDAILSLATENILDRRLQTMVHRLGLAKTPYMARQLIVHGHIIVGGRQVTIPSYHVRRGEDTNIGFFDRSPYADPEHPMRRFQAEQRLMEEPEEA
ncbi:MAG: 30S ribosomal protein S4 [Candidatus Heimdallarchaeota archaeon]